MVIGFISWVLKLICCVDCDHCKETNQPHNEMELGISDRLGGVVKVLYNHRISKGELGLLYGR